MIYGGSLIKCSTGGFEKESQGQASEKKKLKIQSSLDVL